MTTKPTSVTDSAEQQARVRIGVPLHGDGQYPPSFLLRQDQIHSPYEEWQEHG